MTAYSFDHGLKVLECALAIGRQADTLGIDTVKTRMEEGSVAFFETDMAGRKPDLGLAKGKTEPA